MINSCVIVLRQTSYRYDWNPAYKGPLYPYMQLWGIIAGAFLIILMGSKAFIGGNPVKKIINSSREIREILAVDLNACNNYKDGAESLKKINCQTLCIFGELDKMVPLKVGEKMAEQIKNSKVEVITNCGHMIIFERAFDMRKKVISFLKNE